MQDVGRSAPFRAPSCKKETPGAGYLGGTGTRVARTGGARGWSTLRAAVSIGTMMEMTPLTCPRSNEHRSFASTVGAIARARGLSGLGCHWVQDRESNRYSRQSSV